MSLWRVVAITLVVLATTGASAILVAAILLVIALGSLS